MQETTEILVVGGGPGGLACATHLARNGAKVVLAERKKSIGTKVCAGGITWGGLIRMVPPDLIERAFPQQHIFTRRQHVMLTEKNPIVATVNREHLGQWMADEARSRRSDAPGRCPGS
jgi:flavin-dependent dehydrogenase